MGVDLAEESKVRGKEIDAVSGMLRSVLNGMETQGMFSGISSQGGVTVVVVAAREALCKATPAGGDSPDAGKTRRLAVSEKDMAESVLVAHKEAQDRAVNAQGLPEVA